MRLLIAEDELDLAEALTVFFEKNHFTVDAVHNGFDAYEYAAAGGYDAIILDIMMPKLDGIQVLQRLRAEGIGTPVMMLTAKGWKDDRITGFNADAAAYLAAALKKGEGYGYCGNYRFYVTADGSGARIAIFLDCYQSLRAVRTVLVWSLAADALCTLLVNSLVALSRMDEETSPLKREPFPISDAVRETAESFTELAASNGHALTVDAAPGLTCCGDEYAVRQLVSILLDNAVKYAAPDSPIGLTLAKSRRGVTLTVSNRCEDAAHIDTSRLFDRFYRADPARSGGNGFGIGLSIARGIAEGHRGSIAAAVGGDTITFTAELR